MILLVFLSPRPIPTSAEEDYLIVRIVNAKYPPSVTLHKDYNSTSFEFVLSFQTINPTSSEIVVPYICAPFPFPYLRTNLRDKSLEVKLRFWVQWIAGDYAILPGTINESHFLSFEVFNYFNKSLPIGTYEMWFDYTNCSVSPVPVVIEKMYVDVTETSITYYFDYNNETRVVSSLQQTSSYSLSILGSFFLVLAVIINRKNKKRLLSRNR